MTDRKLGMKKEYRERTLRNLATSLVLYEKVRTTEARAKAVLPVVERLLSRSFSGSLAARRDAKSLLFDNNAVTKLFEDFPSRQGGRTSGFVRLTKLPARPGDNASMVQMELLLTPIEQLVEQESKTRVSVRRGKTADTQSTEESTTEEQQS